MITKILIAVTCMLTGVFSLKTVPNYNETSISHGLPGYVLSFDDDAHICEVQQNPFIEDVSINMMRIDIEIKSLESEKLQLVYKPAKTYEYDIKSVIKSDVDNTFNFYIESRLEIPSKALKGVKKDAFYLDQNGLKISFDLEIIHHLGVNDVEILVHGQGRIANKKKNYKAKLLFKFVFVTHPPTYTATVPGLYFAEPWTLEKPNVTLNIFEEPLIGSSLYMANAFINYFDSYAPLIIYALTQNPQSFFAIDTLTGEITIAKVIDIEKIYPKTTFTIEVQARIYEKLPFIIPPQKLSLNLHIHDLNDNPPILEQKEYRLSIQENATLPLEIYRFKVYDADITSPPIHRMKINQVNTDSGHSDHTDFVFLTPKEAHELISNQNKNKIPQGITEGNSLEEIETQDDPPIDFGQFDQKEKAKATNKLETNNVLVLTKSGTLDREKVSRYTLLVTITDVTPESLEQNSKPTRKIKGKSYFYTKILIVIDVMDVNDNRPVCSVDKKMITVSDDIEPGTPVGAILSHDLDDPKTSNGRVHHYLNTLKDDSEIVSIEEESGLIRIRTELTEYLDHSVKRYSYRSCNVIGEDFQNFCCHGNFALKIRNFERANKLTPNGARAKDGQMQIKITQPENVHGTAEIFEDISLGNRVFEIKAKIYMNARDRWRTSTGGAPGEDEYSWQRRRSQQIYYKIEPIPIYPLDYLSFFVHPKTGIIYTKAIMDAEQKRIYNIKIKASTGDLVKHETKLLTIHVRDINDSPPVFLDKPKKDPIVFEVKRDSLPGTRVGRLKAWDGDVEEANSKIYYHLTYDSSFGKIKLDKNTGDIFVSGNLSQSSHSTGQSLGEESYAFIVKVTNTLTAPTSQINAFKFRYNTHDLSIIRVRFEIIQDFAQALQDPLFLKLRTKQYNMEIPAVEEMLADQPLLNLPMAITLKGYPQDSQLEELALLEQSYCSPPLTNSMSDGFDQANCRAVSWVDNFLALNQISDQAGLVRQNILFHLRNNNTFKPFTKQADTLTALAQILEPSNSEKPDSMMPYKHGYLKMKVSVSKRKPASNSFKNVHSIMDISAYYLWDCYKSKFILATDPENSQKYLEEIKNYFNTEMANQNLEIKIDSLNYYLKNEGVLSLNYSEACFHVVKLGSVLEPSETISIINDNPKLWNYMRKKNVVQIKKCYTKSLYKRSPLEIVLFGLAILLFISINLLNFTMFFYKKRIIYYTKEDLSFYSNLNKDFGRRSDETGDKDFYFGKRSRDSLDNSINSKSMDFYEWQEKSMDMIEVGPYRSKNDSRLDTTYYEISKDV